MNAHRSPATLLNQHLSLQTSPRVSTRLHESSSSAAEDSEIERLRSMAAKYRAEAAQLEAEKQQQMADAIEKIFQKFDTNKDGEISFEELKDGLEKSLKTELPEKRVQQLLELLDVSGDGALQKDEFMSLEQFRNRLDSLAREEKAQALSKAKEAQKEDEMAKFLQAQLEMINDGAPSAQDKIVSILPYLFPLLDGLQFARFLVLENPENPISGIIAILYGLYRSIPFGGFIAFFALSFLSGNPRINRLIRFNMQQAIYLDIALFFPGLLAALYALIASGTNMTLPPSVIELGSDALFGGLLLTLTYCAVSSLLGQTPDKLPFISDATNSRLPTVDMFDESGRFKNRKDDDKN